jgi:hypothetical protein
MKQEQRGEYSRALLFAACACIFIEGLWKDRVLCILRGSCMVAFFWGSLDRLGILPAVVNTVQQTEYGTMAMGSCTKTGWKASCVTHWM